MADSEEQKSVAPAAGSAYGGLVPRKAGEFHHHFYQGAGGALSACTICGRRISDGQCLGPNWQEWDARMSQRRSLKEQIFHLAYGLSAEGHAEAARAMAEFNAETLRLFPDRFREPTAEEQAQREQFRLLTASLPTPTFEMTAADALRVIRERRGRALYEVPEEQVLEHRDLSAESFGPGTPFSDVTSKWTRNQERLNEQIRAAKEAAWDEGREAEADAHFADGGYGNVQHPKNPYRKDDRD